VVSETGADSYGINFAASGTIINTGTITGADRGIQVGAGGYVANNPAARSPAAALVSVRQTGVIRDVQPI
jgi:hypothetical protein